MNYNNLCYRCFAENRFRGRPCPKCGHRNEAPQISINCLSQGTLLNNRYVVGVALGAGGFGITYKCFDTAMGVICAIKEYFPQYFAQRDKNRKTVLTDPQKLQTYNTIMNRFVDEAKLLKEFNHPNIIRVYDAFFANNTAYYVMEYCDGIDLRQYTGDFRHKLTYDDGMNIMYQVMKGLRYIHKAGVLHRDIAPDNIYITKNKTVKILDFGSARHEVDQLNRNLSVIVKAGYAPIEQYSSKDRQGPYTDVYAFGATFYHLFTGVMPVESTQRMADDGLIPFSRLRPDLPQSLRSVIEASLNLTINGRIKNFDEMMRMLNIQERPPQSLVKTNVSEAVSGSAMRRNTPAVITGETPDRSVSEQKKVKVQASMTQRLIAYTLDAIVYGIIYSLLVFFTMPDDLTAIIVWLLFPVFLSLMNTITELAAGTTLGKAIVGLQVCDIRADRPSASQIIVRNLIKILGIISLFFSKNGILLEDRVTTCVVCEK